MSKLFIFAIGGTGVRVLRSTMMLLAAGVPAFNKYDIYPVIIDYDAENKDTIRTRELVKLYNKINKTSYKMHAGVQNVKDDTNQGEFFGCPIKELDGLSDYVLEFNPGDVALTFRTKIDYDNMTGNMQNTQALIDSLYDTSYDAQTELNLNLKVGFKGNPNIGSVLFNKLGDEDAIIDLCNTQYRINNGDKVVIIGSLFGGTGASGIPVLVQLLRTGIPQGVNMAALMMQPYFAPEQKEDGAINSRLFDSKTKAALNFYEKSGIQNYVAAYHIGDPYPTKVKYSEGGQTQKNNANMVELIASMAIAHFADGKGQVGHQYMFGLQCDISSGIDANGQQLNNRIYIDDFDQASKENVLKYLTALAYGIKYVKDEVLPNKVDKNTSYVSALNINEINRNSFSEGGVNKLQVLFQYLKQFIPEFTGWLEEMSFPGDEQKRIPANSHQLVLYNFDKEISELVVKPETRKAKHSRFPIGFGSSSKSISLTPQMNAKLKVRGHFDETQLRTAEKEFVFMDILRAACIDSVQI